MSDAVVSNCLKSCFIHFSEFKHVGSQHKNSFPHFNSEFAQFIRLTPDSSLTVLQLSHAKSDKRNRLSPQGHNRYRPSSNKYRA